MYRSRIVWSIVILCAFLFAATLSYAVPYDWTLYYTHKNANGAGDNNKFSIRGLATSEDGSNTLYYGHIKYAYDGVLPAGSQNIVRMDLSGNVINYIAASQPKALATDDRGYVFAGAGANVNVYPNNLSALSATIGISGATAIEGLTVVHQSGNYYLYTSDRNSGKIARYNVNNVNSPTLDTSWGIAGMLTLPQTDERGIMAPDSSGNIWVADKGNNVVYKIAFDGLSYASTSVSKALDVVAYGDWVFISRQDANNSSIVQLNASDMSVYQTLTSSMINTAYPSHYGFGGIDIINGYLYVADEDAYRSDHTGIDDPSGFDPSNYGPETHYFDRIFKIELPPLPSEEVPEPATLALIIPAFATILTFRRKSKMQK